MSINPNLYAAITQEAERIEEDTEHSFKGHYNASNTWGYVHAFIGVPMSILAAWASIDAFSVSPEYAGYLALATATLAAIQTFTNPSEKSATHKASGGDYHALRNTTRRFREIELPTLSIEEAKEGIKTLAEKCDELNRISPCIPCWAYWKAKKDVDSGLSRYRTDHNNA